MSTQTDTARMIILQRRRRSQRVIRLQCHVAHMTLTIRRRTTWTATTHSTQRRTYRGRYIVIYCRIFVSVILCVVA